MIVSDVMDHFREIGTWVDWSDTHDVVLHGAEDAEVSGIAVGWIASERAVREAADRGADLFVSHEGLYLDHPHVPDGMREVLEARCSLYDELGMTVIRCHDTWDRMPEIGIPGAWATWLGFQTERHDAVETELGARRAYYEICLTGGMALESLALLIAQRCRELGQSSVFAAGEGMQFVRRLAVGTGAITRLNEMIQLEPDAIVVTDDGNTWTRDVLYAQAVDVPLIWVTHPVSELPGMMRLADYLADKFPEMSVRYQPIEYPRTVSAR
jgi:putative NIF3 family GTP cyclohydrolase 1 type 2